jgi:exopolysaccharide biosynthesis protein
MKKHYISILFAVVAILLLPGTSSAQIDGFKKIKWGKEKIAPGLIWKYCHTYLNDSVPQNINLLIVNLKKRGMRLIHDPQKNVRTSIQASEAGAIAAVNGGFFNVRNGGSVSYLKMSGRIVDTDTAKKWLRNTNLNGAVIISNSGDVMIEKRLPNSWYDSHPEYEDILVTGPLLIENGTLSSLPETSLVTNKHPRTSAGIRNSKKVILMTLDGRAEEAAGMTLNELAEFMHLLGCRDAVNFDGGGSTTMWINKKPFNGIVNMPSDNKKFDHEGERAVANIMVIR